MRILVCGGRDFDDWELFCQGIEELYMQAPIIDDAFEVDFMIIQGGATGADFLAKVWAKHRHINCVEFKITKDDWKRYGNGAGPRRNGIMLRDGRPSHILAFPGGNGTADMVKQAREAGIPVVEIKRTDEGDV